MKSVTWLAEKFMDLFRHGGEVFVGMLTDIVPLLIMPLVAMNAMIRLIGEKEWKRLRKNREKTR